MANLVITSTTNSVIINFNSDASSVGFQKATWTKNSVLSITLSSDNSFVTFATNAGDAGLQYFKLSFESSEIAFKVDSVSGVSPTSNSDLFDKISALIQ